MLEETLEILHQYLWKATYETFQMVIISLLAALVFGTLLGLVLYMTETPLLTKNRTINIIAGAIVNLIRSIPFIILLVVLIPLTKLIAGTTIGPLAASVPLSFCAIAFHARLIEGAFADIDRGVIESSVATGASMKLIISHVLLVEARPGIIRAITVTLVSLIGYSAMAGIVGGGGIGDLAIQFGYYRYETGVMIVTVVLLVIIVQVAQIIGDKIAGKFVH
ncbi:MAG: ABC transporter permease [Spirochaetia bacterium]|jgi:D-methionine transport system permease protein|nr:ABC transporter permease [Spirochaetia bacterium]